MRSFKPRFTVFSGLALLLLCQCDGSGSGSSQNASPDAGTAAGGSSGASSAPLAGTSATAGTTGGAGGRLGGTTARASSSASSTAAGGGGAAGNRTAGTTTGGTLASGGRGGTGGENSTTTLASGGKSSGTSGGKTSGGASTVGGTSAVGGSKTGGTSAMGGTSAAGGTTAITTVPTGSGAPEATPTGYGKDTTGGGNASAVNVADLAAAQAAIDNYAGSGGLVLKYTGKFDFASITDPCTQHSKDAQTLEIKKKSDITILGADGSSANFSIHIAASSSNIIVRNMTIGLTPGGDASDMISIEGMSGGVPTDIWIDHNTLFSALVQCAGAGDTSFDGMIDIKKGADRVTVSYNHMHDHAKVTLNGYSDSDDAIRHVTFHHNVFENVGSRTPLQRNGYSHLFNNLFSKVTVSGINVRMGGYALVEANYFENVKNPVTSRDSDQIGYWELRDNNLASKADVSAGNAFGITWDAGNTGTVNATEWTTTKAFPKSLGYDYTAHGFACVRDGLRAVAGAGKGLATLACK